MTVLYPKSTFKLAQTFRLGCFGPTGSGKTTLLADLCNYPEQFILTVGDTLQVLYCYNSVKPDIERETFFHRGLPDIGEILSLKRDCDHLVVVWDDLLEEFRQLDRERLGHYHSFLIDLSRKANISLILVSQTLFYPQCHFVRLFIRAMTTGVLFQFNADRHSLSRFVRQVYPDQRAYFYESYSDATDQSQGLIGGYLVCPISQSSPIHPTDLRLRNFLSVPEDPDLVTSVYRSEEDKENNRGNKIYENRL